MAVAAVVTELSVLILSTPFSKPGRNREIGKRKGYKALGKSIQNIGPSGLLIRQPLKIEGGDGSVALFGRSKLYDVCKFVCDHIPGPVVGSARENVDGGKEERILVVLEVGGAVRLVCASGG